MFDAAAATDHLNALARKHGVEIVWQRKSMHLSEANLTTRQVFVPRMRSALGYMIALHEFGHIVDKVAGFVLKDHGPGCEAAAWAWAASHARPELLAQVTVRQWNVIGESWVTSIAPRPIRKAFWKRTGLPLTPSGRPIG